MLSRYFFYFVCLITFFFPFSSSAFQFTRSLSVGSVGQDVLELQKFLNKDFQTRVADSGPGSLGNETTYFGFLTKLAVASFQNKYKNEVLLPIGLSSPTGFVGPQTLKKLNNLQNVGVGTISQNQTIENDLPQTVSQLVPTFVEPSVLISNLSVSPPEVWSLSKYDVVRGETVTITGNMFSEKDNQIHFSGARDPLKNISSEDGFTLTFVVPDWLQDGSYNLWVTNSNGSSFNSSFGNYFKVSSQPRSLPKVISITPNKITLSSDQDIIIKGENFASKNDIYSNLGEVRGVVSGDGKSIRIRLSQFPQFSSIKDTQSAYIFGNYSLEVFFQVKNEVGFSQEQIPLILELK